MMKRAMATILWTWMALAARSAPIGTRERAAAVGPAV